MLSLVRVPTYILDGVEDSGEPAVQSGYVTLVNDDSNCAENRVGSSLYQLSSGIAIKCQVRFLQAARS